MSLRGIPCAYLVTPILKTVTGCLIAEAETICFDRELAIEMADADRDRCAWVAVYALDSDGRCLRGGPIYSIGTLGVSTAAPERRQTRFGPMQPPSGMQLSG
ncbi:hypothetical protein V5F59_15740 [Xanthobacter autotrophicus DSM 431]|uniref:hypothetical protein n=1 Tax=Xanthobacter nonsaccharivorans TaxID=3119912 RepID=UPI003726D2E6